MAVFALLCGVLVIAFPVSVFSELWSKELEQMGELRNLYDHSTSHPGEDEDEDDMSYESSDDKRAPVKFVSTTSMHNCEVPQDTTPSFSSMVMKSPDDLSRGSSDSLIKTGSGVRVVTRDSVYQSNQMAPGNLTANDIAELRRCMNSVRKILSKLDPVE